jgi:hypothetical protein
VAMTARVRKTDLLGQPKPRIAPPIPARTLVAEFERTCEEMEIELIPWQRISARYAYAIDANDNWLYPEYCEVASRQNGKTKPLIPHIVTRMRMRRRVMHTAQNRELPREVFSEVADFFGARPGELMVKGGRIVMPRFANGQEEIRLKNGASYRIVAPTRGGARGPSNDDVIIDEVRELDDYDFIAAAKPTLMASRNPQMAYKSNAGDESSVVLNGLRLRALTDPALAYLEWSAAPERAVDDIIGWLEGNPSIGHLPGLLENLKRDFQSHRLQGTLAIFETENLCRQVTTMRELLVNSAAWLLCKGEIGKPVRPGLAVSMDPKGSRASVALAWKEGEGVAVRLLLNVTGSPIDTDDLGTQVKALASKYGVKPIDVGYDPLTDAELVKYVKGKCRPISGQLYANASAQFVNMVNAGKLKYADCDPVTDDLTWTSRKPDGEAGSYHAVRALDDRPITASLAAIRAVWLASGPTPATPRVM